MKTKNSDFAASNPKRGKKLDSIAQVGARLFATKGYMETSVDDIADAARVTKGGIYYYFGSKTDILFYISSTYIDHDREGLELALGGIPEITEKIRHIVFHHISHYVSNPAAAKTLLHESYNLPPKLLKEVRIREKQYFKIVSATINAFLKGKATKELTTTLTFTLFGMMNWIYKWYDPKGKINPEKLSNIIYDTFIQGVKNTIL